LEHLNGLTRRRFIQSAAALAAAAAIGDRLPAQPAARASRVIRAHNVAATADFAPQAGVVEAMMRTSIRALTGVQDEVAGLGKLMGPVGPEQRIVIKVNSMGGPPAIGTSAEAVRGLVVILRELLAGQGTVGKDQITVWDNAPVAYLEPALDGLCLIQSTYLREQWDVDPHARVVLPHPPSSPGLPVQRVLSQADHLISFGALKAHPLAGTCGVLKNYFGAVPLAVELHSHAPMARSEVFGPWNVPADLSMAVRLDGRESLNATLKAGTYSGDEIVGQLKPQLGPCEVIKMDYMGDLLLLAAPGECKEMAISGPLAGTLGVPEGTYFATDVNQTIAELYGHEMLGGKTRLCVIDGLRAIYDEGPYHEPHEFETYPERTPNTLLLSTDPVAIDAAATEIVAAERKLHEGLRDGFDIGYLKAAEATGLGQAEGYEVVEA